MSCPDHDALMAFADAELDPSSITHLEQHLAVCAPCREFVDEMRRLNAYGRASLQGIRVNGYVDAVSVPDPIARGSRLLGTIPLAAAAIIILTAAVAALFVGHRFSEPRQTTSIEPRAIERVDGASTAGNQPIAASADEAFDRWAEPYRRLRIPLVPMEDLANYHPVELDPIQPGKTL